MRDAARIDKILADLKEIWKKLPDLRLGQLICNVVSDPALYYMEDAELIDCLKKYYSEGE